MTKSGARAGSTAAQFTVFAGHLRVASGALPDVVSRAKEEHDRGGTERVAIFENHSGRPVDFDFSGTLEDVLARLPHHPVMRADSLEHAMAERRGPGRPRLGVVSREVSLLPRHWEWLAEQKGGASAALRRLVDDARHRGQGKEQRRRAIEAVHRFLWDMGGDLPDFEEAARALFAGRFAEVRDRIATWPTDVRTYAEGLLRAVPADS